MEPLRKFNETHIDEDCTKVTGTQENVLFYGCKFDKVAGLELLNCVLDHSKFTTSSIKDALGFSLTLDCFSFRDVEYSELLFDLFLCLACMTKGNDAKRAQLKQVVGPARYQAIMRILGTIE